MHPLTVTWAPHIYTEWGWKNFQSWLHAGFDNYLNTPNGRTHRLLTRLAVENLFHPFQAFMLGQKTSHRRWQSCSTSPWCSTARTRPNTEIHSRIPTRPSVIGVISPPRTRARFISACVSVKDLVEKFGVPEVDLVPYFPADPVQIAAKKIEVHYLGYYLEVASTELLLLRGRARRLPGIAGAHAGHLQQIQLDRRPHRRLPLLHDLHQVRHRARDL